MFKKFYPDFKVKSIDDLDKSFFVNNNIKFLLLDIDNTLVAYTEPKPDAHALEFLQKLDEWGVCYCFVSNNHEERVASFLTGMKKIYFADAHKPCLKITKKAMCAIGAEKSKTAIIGDQVFTDVYTANRAGLISVMVEPIEPKETPFFGFKRAMEKIVLKNYKG